MITLKELKKLIDSLGDSFNRWRRLKAQGGNDPLYPDGLNLFLIRNHITYYKTQIEELCEEKGIKLPDIYYKRTPPEMERDYMARADEIRTGAREALKKYKESSDYQYLVKTIHLLSKEQIRQTSIDNVVGYCTRLDKSIKDDDLVSMRRHERYKGYLQQFANCKKQVEEILKAKPDEGQVTLFEMLA